MTLTRFGLLISLCVFASGALASASAQTNQEENIAKARAFYEAHLAQLDCGPEIMNFDRWQNFPVKKCSYKDVGITTQVVTLNPSADQLARWTVTACLDAQASSMNKCIKRMERVIQGASSGIFPVSGYIVEPAESAGGQGNGALCMLFRDGVTIATATFNTRAPVNGKCGPEDENSKPAIRAKKFARVASTRRQDYLAAGGTDPVGTEANGDIRWLDVVRKLYQEAWTSDRNQLISAKARAEKASGAFN